jgi:hypothetical protein
MSELTVIIPVHKFDDGVSALLDRAIASVDVDIKINISTTTDLADKIKSFASKYEGREINVISLDEKSDFQTLVNNAVENVDTEYFSILEYDDEYTKIWFGNVYEYLQYKPDVSVFLPIEDIVDFNNKSFISFGNEAPWASSFSNEIGYIDLDCLTNFFDFYLTGGVFNIKDWKSTGGLKDNIKLTFWYEFLMRMTHKGKKVFVIPKVGYVHYLGREDSLIEEYKKTVDEKESKYWVDVARKEYMFKKRDIEPYKE